MEHVYLYSRKDGEAPNIEDTTQGGEKKMVSMPTIREDKMFVNQIPLTTHNTKILHNQQHGETSSPPYLQLLTKTAPLHTMSAYPKDLSHYQPKANMSNLI